MWKNYWPIYERIEKEIAELTFSVFWCDAHLSVYSIKMADLLIRIGTECENIAKALAKDREFLPQNGEQIENLNFPKLGNLLSSHINFRIKELDIIWAYKNLSCNIITPFNTWNETESSNPEWYKAYNDLKHARDQKFHTANLKSIMNGLAGLFILNLWLRKPEIEKEHEWVEFTEKRIQSYSNLFTPKNFLFLSGQGGTTRSLIIKEN